MVTLSNMQELFFFASSVFLRTG